VTDAVAVRACRIRGKPVWSVKSGARRPASCARSCRRSAGARYISGSAGSRFWDGRFLVRGAHFVRKGCRSSPNWRCFRLMNDMPDSRSGLDPLLNARASHGRSAHPWSAYELFRSIDAMNVAAVVGMFTDDGVVRFANQERVMAPLPVTITLRMKRVWSRTSGCSWTPRRCSRRRPDVTEALLHHRRNARGRRRPEHDHASG
jgi:hypothetical protein